MGTGSEQESSWLIAFILQTELETYKFKLHKEFKISTSVSSWSLNVNMTKKGYVCIKFKQVELHNFS